MKTETGLTISQQVVGLVRLDQPHTVSSGGVITKRDARIVLFRIDRTLDAIVRFVPLNMFWNSLEICKCIVSSQRRYIVPF